jgi:hypothetical protein
VARGWLEDTTATITTAFSGTSDPADCTDLTAAVARDLSARLPGAPTVVRPDAGQTLVTGPLLTWVTVIGPLRLSDRLGQNGYRSRRAPAYEDLTRAVRRLKRARRAGRLLLAVELFAALAAVRLAHERSWWALVAAAVVWQAHRFRRPLPRGLPRAAQGSALSSPTAVLGVALRGLTNLGALLLLLWYGGVVVAGMAAQQDPALPFEARSLADRDPSWENVLRAHLLAFGGIGQESTGRFALGVLMIVALVLALLQRFGRRLSALSAEQALQADERPHLLYLRSFDEDKVKVSATVSRGGLLARLAMRRRRRFEEVLVEQLSVYGPVIAVSPPGRILPALGAARASLGNDEWQGEVERWASSSLAVVLSATPSSVRQGYGWEIDLVARRLPHRRVLVVLAPWRTRVLQQRWREFARRISDVSVFSALVPAFQSGLHVAVHTGGGVWQGYGGRRRDEDSYALALHLAVTGVVGSWRAAHARTVDA